MCNKNIKIGVAVVGLGVGEQHARAYLATESCELLWLNDLDLGKARHLAEKFITDPIPTGFRRSSGFPGTSSTYNG